MQSNNNAVLSAISKNPNVVHNLLYNNQSKQQYSPPQQQIQVQKKFTINYTDLKEGFKKTQIDGYLNKERFNQTITHILKFDIPIISNTYLSERLFDLLDESGDGRIQENEYLDGMKNVFCSREMKERFSFMAMMRKKCVNKTYLDFNEIFEYFYNSWLSGFRVLSDMVNKDKGVFLSKNLYVPNKTQMESFAAGYEEKIKTFLIGDLRECGIDVNKKIEFDQFRRWINKDNTLQICFGPKGINVAVSLIVLDDIGYNDNSLYYPNFK